MLVMLVVFMINPVIGLALALASGRAAAFSTDPSAPFACA